MLYYGISTLTRTRTQRKGYAPAIRWHHRLLASVMQPGYTPSDAETVLFND